MDISTSLDSELFDGLREVLYCVKSLLANWWGRIFRWRDGSVLDFNI